MRPPPTCFPIQRFQTTNMAFMLPGLRRGLIASTPFILSTPLLMRQMNRPILCDSPDPLAKITSDLRNTYSRETPVIKQSGAANPRVVRQISMGSILGVLGGMGVSVFSKPLALLIGLGVILVQVRGGRNIHNSLTVRGGYHHLLCYALLCLTHASAYLPSMCITQNHQGKQHR